MKPPPKTVLVLRALQVGDLLCATPALRALRHGLPDAHISLLTLPWARSLCARLPSVDEFIEFPGWPGLPERAPAESRMLQRFQEEMRARHFDLALQMHGSGTLVNTLVASFGATQMAGYTSTKGPREGPEAADLMAWPQSGSEVERLLQLTDHLGLPRQGEALDFPLRPADFEEADLLLQGLGHETGGWRRQPLALVHAGAQLPSQRWPPERFAAVADALADAGLAVLLTGSAAEAGLAREVAAAMQAPALDLSGLTTLWVLGALAQRAAVVVCNDTSLSQIAAAVDTPSVVVASGSDVQRWAPADATRHRVLWHGAPSHPCALAVGVDEVREAALAAVGLGRVEDDLPAGLELPVVAPRLHAAQPGV